MFWVIVLFDIVCKEHYYLFFIWHRARENNIRCTSRAVDRFNADVKGSCAQLLRHTYIIELERVWSPDQNLRPNYNGGGNAQLPRASLWSVRKDARAVLVWPLDAYRCERYKTTLSLPLFLSLTHSYSNAWEGIWRRIIPFTRLNI